MPATLDQRAQIFLDHLEARFKGRLAISVEETASWLAEAFGVKDSYEVCRKRLASLDTRLGLPALLGKQRRYPLMDLAIHLANGFDTTSETDAILATRTPLRTLDKPKSARGSRDDVAPIPKRRSARPSTVGFICVRDTDSDDTTWTWATDPEAMNQVPHFHDPRTRDLHERRVSHVCDFWNLVQRQLGVIEAKGRADFALTKGPTHSKPRSHT